jgi:hypothetical protein
MRALAATSSAAECEPLERRSLTAESARSGTIMPVLLCVLLCEPQSLMSRPKVRLSNCPPQVSRAGRGQSSSMTEDADVFGHRMWRFEAKDATCLQYRPMISFEALWEESTKAR